MQGPIQPSKPRDTRDSAPGAELSELVRRDTIAIITCSALLFICGALLVGGTTNAAEPRSDDATGPVPGVMASVPGDASAASADLDVEALAPLAQIAVWALPGQVGAHVARDASAELQARCAADNLGGARSASHDGQLERAAELLELELACTEARAAAPEHLARTRFLLAHVRQLQARHDDALTHADALADVADAVPVLDYVSLMRARSLHALGRHDEALAAWEQTAAADARGPLYHEAIVGRAETLFDAQRWEEAEAALDRVVTDYPEHPNFERLLLKRGQARQRLGRDEDAARDFDHIVFEWPWKDAALAASQALEELAAAGTPVPTHTYEARFERAGWLRKNRHWDLAEAALRDMLAEHATASGRSSEENRLRFQLALNFYDASRYDEALPILEGLVALHEQGHGSGTSLNTLYTYIERSHSYSGRYDEALAALNTRIARFSSGAQKRALASFYENNGRFDRALRLYDQILPGYQKRTWDYAFLLHRAGKHDDAAELLEDLRRRSSGTTRARYEYWLARAYQEGGHLERARSVFASLVADHSADYYGIQAQNRIFEIDHYEHQVAPLVAAARASRTGTHGGIGHGLPADAVARADVATAAASAAPVLTSDGETVASGSETDAGVGADSTVVARSVGPALSAFADPDDKAADGRGPREVAARASAGGRTVAIADVPHSLEARDQITTGPARIHWGAPVLGAMQFVSSATARGSDVESGNGELKPAYAAGTPVTGALARAAETYGELFPRLRRASFLFDVGLETEARWEARDVAIEYRLLRGYSRAPAAGKPIALRYTLGKPYIDNRRTDRHGFWGMRTNDSRYPVPADADARDALAARQGAIIEKKSEMEPALMLALKEAGDFHIVRRFTQGTGYHRTDPMTGDMRAQWMEVYPRAFPRLVQTHAREQGLDPYLMWALMTVESTHNPDSISYADARGLLQVIPKTGIKCATSLGVDDYGPFDLLDERISIRFGTWYFSQLVKKFHGQELFAIAGYNGGPHNVARWVAQRGHAMDMDEFVETIPFDQARGYVKKVLRYAALYQRLYEANPTVYVGNRIEPVFEHFPNY